MMRQVPLNVARTLGWLTRKNRAFPAMYILTMFIVIPLILLATSSLFESGGAYIAIGALLVAVFVCFILRTVWFFFKQDGWNVFVAKLDKMQQAADFKRDCMGKVLVLRGKDASERENIRKNHSGFVKLLDPEYGAEGSYLRFCVDALRVCLIAHRAGRSEAMG